MLKFPIKNLFIEGPDCSGKTTLVRSIHTKTGYRWHIHDRSQVSRKVFAKMYNRDLPYLDSDLHLEVSDLNNRFVFLIPDPEVIKERFDKRGDEIHNEASIMKVWSEFSELEEVYSGYPNMIFKTQSDSNKLASSLIPLFHMQERPQLREISDMVRKFVESTSEKESYPLQFTVFDDGDFEEADKSCMDYEPESEYYRKIYEKFHTKIKRELNGENEYNRKESSSSRRFVYTDDSCISFIQCAIRKSMMDFNVVIRSSDTENTFEHDLKFLYYLIFSSLYFFFCKFSPIWVRSFKNK